ncbi:MAG: ABC transporter permease [Muribaculaceae bacterium]|nr:ABC transporter permease [Muribaculaceae bacterium]
MGVLIFFFVLPLCYPVVYTLIYNPEVANEIPMAVVDNCRSSDSRRLIQKLDATSGIKVIGYAANMIEAKQWYAAHGCYGIIEIPSSYSKSLNSGSGSQATIPYYCDMSLMLRYREILLSITNVILAENAFLQHRDFAFINDFQMSSPVETQSIIIGNPSQGFASFAIPAILVLILQQSLILGIAMLGSRENQRNTIGIKSTQLPIISTIAGKTLCYLTIYFPMSIFCLHYIPIMFDLPCLSSLSDAIVLILPMLIASSMAGLSLQRIIYERESVFLMIVFSSVIFLFLSGITWPRYAMPPIWSILGSLIPSTWGIEGFVQLNCIGTDISKCSHSYTMLWILSGVYFICAFWSIYHERAGHNRRVALKK